MWVLVDKLCVWICLLIYQRRHRRFVHSIKLCGKKLSVHRNDNAEYHYDLEKNEALKKERPIHTQRNTRARVMKLNQTDISLHFVRKKSQHLILSLRNYIFLVWLWPIMFINHTRDRFNRTLHTHMAFPMNRSVAWSTSLYMAVFNPKDFSVHPFIHVARRTKRLVSDAQCVGQPSCYRNVFARRMRVIVMFKQQCPSIQSSTADERVRGYSGTMFIFFFAGSPGLALLLAVPRYELLIAHYVSGSLLTNCLPKRNKNKNATQKSTELFAEPLVERPCLNNFPSC